MEKRIRKVIKLPTEAQEQTKLCNWLTKKGIWFYAIPNGGKRDPLEAIKFKRCGVKPGVPDICIPHPLKGFHGAYVEMKRQKGGTLSAYQSEWLFFLERKGYFVTIAHGFEEAKEKLEDYFSLPPFPEVKI